MSFVDQLSFLPHGPEFRFIDEIVALDPGKTGLATYRIRGDEPFLRGHFPGQPLFPGALLIEAGAQLAGVVAQADPSRKPLASLKLTAVRSAKILGSAVPGEILRIEAEVSGRMGALVQAQVEIACGDRLLLQCAVTLAGEAEGSDLGA
jgi:3-hydroxyacyl-[acyl-carrier-protein] dehydratase